MTPSQTPYSTALYVVAVAILALTAWELAGRLGLINPLILSSPSQIALAAWSDGWTFLLAFGTTLREMAIAILMAWTLGIIVGAILALNDLLAEIVAPILAAIIAIPLVVVYPLIVVWAGIDSESKIVFGFLSGVFPIVLSTLAAIQSADWEYAKMASSFGATPSQVILRVLWADGFSRKLLP
jgi:ABC-type nitrate/sulfonate/bicarbonate transport system permease component